METKTRATKALRTPRTTRGVTVMVSPPMRMTMILKRSKIILAPLLSQRIHLRMEKIPEASPSNVLKMEEKQGRKRSLEKRQIRALTGLKHKSHHLLRFLTLIVVQARLKTKQLGSPFWRAQEIASPAPQIERWSLGLLDTNLLLSKILINLLRMKKHKTKTWLISLQRENSQAFKSPLIPIHKRKLKSISSRPY
jgi:hypothetical protein